MNPIVGGVLASLVEVVVGWLLWEKHQIFVRIVTGEWEVLEPFNTLAECKVRQEEEWTLWVEGDWNRTKATKVIKTPYTGVTVFLHWMRRVSCGCESGSVYRTPLTHDQSHKAEAHRKRTSPD